MIYGLYDADYQFYKKCPFFNLELMKLARFYKDRREIITFSPTFSPQMYGKFFVRQDYPFPHEENYGLYKNIIYGGRAFDGEKYRPLDIEIEKCAPDTSIYDKIESQRVDDLASKTQFNVMRRAEHIRLSLDGKTIWQDFESQFRHAHNNWGIILHDYNLGQIPGARAVLEDILPKVINHPKGKRIGVKYPIQISHTNSLINWAKFDQVNDFFYLQYNGIPHAYVAEELAAVNRVKKFYGGIIINPTQNVTYEYFENQGINNLFHIFLDLQSIGIKMQLIFDKDFFVDKEWILFLQLLDSKKYPWVSFYEYVRGVAESSNPFVHQISLWEARKLFQFVKKKNLDLFQDLYTYKGRIE